MLHATTRNMCARVPLGIGRIKDIRTYLLMTREAGVLIKNQILVADRKSDSKSVNGSRVQAECIESF